MASEIIAVGFVPDPWEILRRHLGLSGHLDSAAW